MSLQVWLPLISNVQNQGLSNVTVTNNGATINNSGKIGKCYSFDGNDDYISLTSPILYSTITGGTKPFSIAMWVYHADSTRAVLFGDYNLGGINFNIELTTNHAVRFYWNGSPDKNFTTTVDSSQWTHICLVYDGSQILIYKNGIIENDKYNGALVIKTKTSGAYYLGRDQRTGTTAFNGKLNDFRIYDHALSAKEVEEIAKGLVLHYKLDNNGLGNPNLIANSKQGGSWGYASSGYDRYATNTLVVPDKDVYTLSFEAKSTVNGDKMRTHYYYPNTTTTCVSSQGITKTASDGHMDFTLTTTWTRYWVTYYQSATTTVKRLICPRLMEGQGTGTVSVRNVKFEEGSVATPWIPATSDAIYSQFIGDTNTIYDSSGYSNNGTIIGSLETVAPSPRYEIATKFNGSSAIKVNNNDWMAQGASELTVNIWAYMDNWSNWNGHRLYSCTEGGGFNIENTVANSLTFPVCVYTNTAHSTTGYIPTESRAAILKTDLTSGWHMLTYVYTETECQCYLDRVLYQTKPYTSYGVYFNLNSSRLFLGCEANGVNASSPYFIGQESDFRIYYTALTPEQIKELYNTSMSIDNNGNIHARELVEL